MGHARRYLEHHSNINAHHVTEQNEMCPNGLPSFHMTRIVQGMTYPTMQQVAEYIDAERRGQGLTYAELARRTGLSARAVRARLTGERPIHATDLYKFAAALGTTPGEIYAKLG